jgi:hypothetical protein
MAAALGGAVLLAPPAGLADGVGTFATLTVPKPGRATTVSITSHPLPAKIVCSRFCSGYVALTVSKEDAELLNLQPPLRTLHSTKGVLTAKDIDAEAGEPVSFDAKIDDDEIISQLQNTRRVHSKSSLTLIYRLHLSGEPDVIVKRVVRWPPAHDAAGKGTNDGIRSVTGPRAFSARTPSVTYKLHLNPAKARRNAIVYWSVLGPGFRRGSFGHFHVKGGRVVASPPGYALSINGSVVSIRFPVRGTMPGALRQLAPTRIAVSFLVQFIPHSLASSESILDVELKP